jgi:hypothetical protein
MRGKHVAPERVHQRLYQERYAAQPARQGGAFQLDTHPRINLRLPVERQRVGKFADGDMRQQCGPRQAAVNRPDRRGHLRNPLTACATELRPDMANHLEPGRHILQHFRHVLADPLHGCAAVGAGRIRRMDDRLARQVLGQRLADRLARRQRRRHQSRLRRADLELAYQQLELLDALRELLRGATELHAAQARQFQLELLDPCPQIHELLLPGLQLRITRLQGVVAIAQLRLKVNNERAQRSDVVRECSAYRFAHACIVANRLRAVNDSHASFARDVAFMPRVPVAMCAVVGANRCLRAASTTERS